VSNSGVAWLSWPCLDTGRGAHTISNCVTADPKNDVKYEPISPRKGSVYFEYLLRYQIHRHKMGSLIHVSFVFSI
jgi:hypothetical protein